MSNYPGFYYYQPQVSCSACMDDHDMWGTYPDCVRCKESNKVKVELLQLSGRIFSHKAIVRRHDNGKVITVPLSSLTYGWKQDG